MKNTSNSVINDHIIEKFYTGVAYDKTNQHAKKFQNLH